MREWLKCALMTITVIGGINWGLVGLLRFNLVSFLFGTGPLARMIYIAVGVASIVWLVWCVIEKYNYDPD